MKKLLVLALCLVVLFTFSACSGTQFLSKSKVERLEKKYGTPQMEMVLSFETKNNAQPIKLKVTYDLLLGDTPVAVTSFINLLNQGRYDNVVIDEKNTTYKYFGIGNLSCADTEAWTFDLVETSKTFIGEFKTNNFTAYGDDYAQFEMFSLAMWHDTATSMSDEDDQQDEYSRANNSANGRLVLAYSTQTLNHTNYAVFAKPVSFEIAYDDGEYTKATTKINSAILESLLNLTTTTVNGLGDSKTYKPLKVSVSFSMVSVEGIDWTKISDNFLVDAE